MLVLSFGLVSCWLGGTRSGLFGAGGPQPSLSGMPRSPSTMTGSPLRRPQELAAVLRGG